MTDIHPEHLGSGGLGALLTGGLMWAWKVWRRDRQDSREEGALSQRVAALEQSQKETREDLREMRTEMHDGFREVRELLLKGG
jgi:hypothetical protein